MAEFPRSLSLDLVRAGLDLARRQAIVADWTHAAAESAKRPRPVATDAEDEGSTVDLEEAVEGALADALSSSAPTASLTESELRRRTAELFQLAESRGLLLAANSEPAPAPAILFALADFAEREALANPARAQLAGDLVLSLAPRCETTARLRADLEAAGWAVVANGHLRAAAPRKADEAYARALEARTRGTCDPLLEARLETLAANLRSDQSRFASALTHARKALRIYQELGLRHEAAKARIRAAIHLSMLEPTLEPAIRELEKALPGIDADREPRALLSALHNLAYFLADAEQVDAAEAHVPRLLALAEALGNPYDLARVDWLRARIAAHRDELVESEILFRRVLRVWVDAEYSYDVALTSLELAAVLLAAGQREEVRELCLAALPIFQNEGVAPEALAALQLVTAAAQADALERSILLRAIALVRGRRLA